MTMKKIEDEKIRQIALEYAQGNDNVNKEKLANNYNVCEKTIRNCLHYAIEECLIPLSAAEKIRDKAIRHDTKRKLINRYYRSHEVERIYNDLIFKRMQKMVQIIDDLTSKYNEVKYHLDSYNDTMSSSDEFPDDEDELLKQICKIREQIERIKKLDYIFPEEILKEEKN